MTCPGALVLSEGMPQQSSKFAEEGTAAHSLAEAILTHKALDNPSPEMLQHVMVYVDYVRELANG